MSSLIAEKYANLLSMRDIVHLFERLEETVGNRTDAARMCGLERKTTYGWKKAGEIRLKTKKKIVAALIENLSEETLDFIVQSSVEASTDVLHIYLSALYEKAVDERTNATEFLRLVSKFDHIKQKYSGLMVEHLQIEVGNMLRNISERALELGISFKPSPFKIVKLTEFSTIVPNLIKTISVVSSHITEDEIAKMFNIPVEFVHAISTALYDNYVIPQRAMEPLTIEAPPSKEKKVAGTMHARAPLEPTEEYVWNELRISGGTAS